MKVLFITQEDPIYVAEFWEEFLKFKNELKTIGINVTGLVSLAPLGKSKKTSLFKRVYGMYGSFGTLKVGIRYIVAILKKRSIKRFAENLDTKFLNVRRIHSSEFIQFASRNDLIISVAASRKFKPSLLNAPKYGCINIHSGPLPKYQGMMPVFWQMKNGEKRVGITIHKMNEEIDKGDILYQKFIDISDCDTLDKAIKKTKKAGAKMMYEFLKDFERYYNNPKTNNKESATYFSFPDKNAVREFVKTGRKLI